MLANGGAKHRNRGEGVNRFGNRPHVVDADQLVVSILAPGPLLKLSSTSSSSVASRHTITHEVQNDNLDIRPRKRALDLDGPVFARWCGRLGRQIGGFKG